MVQDEKSHFNGDYATGAAHHSRLEFYDFGNGNDGSSAFAKAKIIQASEQNAYPGTSINRTLAMLELPGVNHPVIIDLVKIVADKDHQYDLPLYFQGQILQKNPGFQQEETMMPLGSDNGYQHLWKVSSTTASEDPTVFSWLDQQKFYTATIASSAGDELILARLGANDPENNLRQQPVLIQRKKGMSNAIFAMAIEAHGSYDPVSEFSTGAYAGIENMEVVLNTDEYIVVNLQPRSGDAYLLMVTLKDHGKSTMHNLTIKELNYQWTGPFWYGEQKKK